MDDLTPAPSAPVETGDTGEPRVPHRLFALKDGDTFLVADAFGDVLGVADGLFRDDTRLLSHFRLLVGGRSPSLLSAAVAQDNVFFTSHGSNRPLPPTGGVATPRGVIHVERKRFLWDQRLYERICCTNYSRDNSMAPISVEFGADFRDMFEVRGQQRTRRGTILDPELNGRSVVFRYEGLDDVLRTSVISFSEPPGRLTAERADFMLYLPSEGTLEIYLEVGATQEEPPSRRRFRAAAARARFAMRAKRRHGARLKSAGRLFNEWIEKSRSDLSLLVTDLPTGPYPYAGIPWFSTAFGRDAIITAWQVLWVNASLARGVLTFLAANQATEISKFRDSQPGKIMHETRKGEMTSLGELPFGQYYGGVDTTPLFVALAGAYAERTGDLEFIDTLWPALEAAVAWMDQFGDSTGDGLIDYQRGADTGLTNQGWKDSADSVFHADGRFAEGPIALLKCRATPSTPTVRWPTWRNAEAIPYPRADGATGPNRSARPWSSASGWRISAATASPSTDEASCAGCARLTRDTCCSAACRRPNAPTGSPASCSPRISRAAGASAPWRWERRATIRCPTTTARSGPTTPRSASPAWRVTASGTAWCGCCRRSSRPPSTSKCACQNCSAASRDSLASRPWPIR